MEKEGVKQSKEQSKIREQSWSERKTVERKEARGKESTLFLPSSLMLVIEDKKRKKKKSPAVLLISSIRRLDHLNSM